MDLFVILPPSISSLYTDFFFFQKPSIQILNRWAKAALRKA